MPLLLFLSKLHFVTNKNLIHNLSITNCRFQQVYKNNNDTNTTNLMVSIYASGFYIHTALFKHEGHAACVLNFPSLFLLLTSSSYCSLNLHTKQSTPKTRTSIPIHNVLRCHRIMKRYDVDYLPQREKNIFFINSLNSISSISTSEKPLILCLC